MRTINRSVKQVAVNEVDNYFFNHVNWKGLCDDKNYLQVDQETLADTNNVYVDLHNVLKSRPPIKTISSYGIINITDIEVFDTLTVIKNYVNSKYTLYFIINGAIVTTLPTVENSRLILIKRRLFIFTDFTFYYFDLDGEIKVCYTAENTLYVPITKISTNGIITTNEDKNELTNSEITRYVYGDVSSVDFSVLYNKNVTVTIANIEYNLDFLPHNEKVFVQPYVATDADYLSISEIGSFIAYNNFSNVISYSVDGKIFTQLPVITFLGDPILSKDGSTVIVFKEDGLYMLSVAATTAGEYTYETWTQITHDSKTLNNENTPSGIFITQDIYAYIFEASSIWYLCISTPDVNAANSDAPKFIALDDTLYDFSVNKPVYALTTNAFLPNFLTIMYNKSSVTDGIDVATFLISKAGAISNEGIFTLSNDDTVLTMAAKDCGMDIVIKTSSAYIVEFDVLIAGAISTDILWTITAIVEDAALTCTPVPTYAQLSTKKSTKFIISSYDSSILTNNYLYVDDTIIFLLFNAIPIYNYGTLYVKYNQQIYTSYLVNPITIDLLIEGTTNYKYFSFVEDYDCLFLAKDNTLYINSQKTDDGLFLWYLPTVNTQEFNSTITNVHILSKTELGVFLKDCVWYVTSSDYGYTYTKSKLQVGCKLGGDVITSYDGKDVIFSTERGLVSMSYQDFVSSTEQTLTYMSDVIQYSFCNYNASAIKLFVYKFWIVCYNGSDTIYIYDIRTSSWWKWSYKYAISKIVNINDTITILSNKVLHKLGDDDCTYFDDASTIDWSLTSQKLHMGAINYYKHIKNITINAISSELESTTFNLGVINYRKSLDERDNEVIEYTVDIARTYVKRLNYGSVNYFQYILSNDTDNVQQSPLSIVDVTIKYGVKGQVR